MRKNPRNLFIMTIMLCLILSPLTHISDAHDDQEFIPCPTFPIPALLLILGLLVIGLVVFLGIPVWIRRNETARDETASDVLPAPRIVSEYFINPERSDCINQGKASSYYKGRIKFIDERNYRDACFLVVNVDEGNRIMEIGSKLNHDGVLKPITVIQNPTFPDGKATGESMLLVVEPFHRLCGNWYNNIKNRFSDPNKNNLIAGNPIKLTQDLIRNLSSSLLYLHSKGYSCSNLSSASVYFWDGVTLKILPDIRKDDNPSSWDATKNLHIEELGCFIGDHLLMCNDPWPERNQFLDCFRTIIPAMMPLPRMINIRKPEHRLQMIIDHPFLCNNVKKIMEIFPDLDHAIESNEYNHRHGLAALADLVDKTPCLDDICFREDPDTWAGTWYASIMPLKFTEVMKYGTKKNYVLNPPATTPASIGTLAYLYIVTDCRELIRFCRNLFAHCYGAQRTPRPHANPPANPSATPPVVPKKNQFTLGFMHEEVNKCWPGLIYRLHELSY